MYKPRAKRTFRPKAKTVAKKTAEAVIQGHSKAGTVMPYQPSIVNRFVRNQMTYVHKYMYNAIFTGGTAGQSGTAFWFGLNDMYDPEVAIGGHQPYGFDQVSNLYSTFTVTDVDINITYVAGSDGSMYVGTVFKPSSGTFNPSNLGFSDLFEKDNSRYFLTPQFGASPKDAVISLGRINVGKVEGVSKKALLDSPEYQGSISASPAKIPQMGIVVGSLSGVTSPTIVLAIELTYHAVWRGPRTVAQS